MTYQRINEIKAYIKSTQVLYCSNVKIFGGPDLYLMIGDAEIIKKLIMDSQDIIIEYYLECWQRNSLMPLINLLDLDARIEPGAIIRENVHLGEKAVVLMGAVINCGAHIGRQTMIDMNAVIGSGAIIGNNSHIGAGAVIAGVMEPISSIPVTIGDNCLIGANAVVLEGVKIGNNAIVGAGAVVTKNVEDNTTVVGIPAKPVSCQKQWSMNEELR